MESNHKKKMFSQGLKTSLDRHALKKSEWIKENFCNPRNDRLPWSFDDHEYQVDICDEQSTDVVIKKCAQVGLSELSLRLSLAFCAMNDYRKMAYILPTAKFASEFSATRLDPAVKASPYVSSVISTDVNNTMVKQIGTCFMVMRGTSGTTSAISIDLDWLLVDEYDFCTQSVLGSFASRLQHSDLKQKTNFSTPTIPDYGVSGLYNDSSRGRYMVRHSKCGKYVAPVFFRDLVIPGFDAPIVDYKKADRFHAGVADAFLLCPKCAKKIEWSDFCDPSRREWVHEIPSAARQGFHVVPWDVPKYNPLSDVLGSINQYNLHSDWVNFRLGLDYASAENSFMVETMRENSKGLASGWKLADLESVGARGVFVGADLGKTSWVVVGVPDNRGGLEVISYESVSVGTLVAGLGPYLEKLFRRLRGSRIVVDAAPNYETAMHLSNRLPDGQAWGAYYGGAKSSSLDIYNFNPAQGIVNIERDAAFDDLATACNSGVVRVRDCAEKSVFNEHLRSMKKVKQMTAKGEAMKWVNTGADHYAHALNYCFTAWASIENREGGIAASAGLSIGVAKLKALS